MSTNNNLEPLASQNVLINGSRVAYGVYGTGDPVLLIHGTPSSSLIWRNIVPDLTAAGYKVHLFDLLGYGCSERPWDQNADTSISGQVPIVEELVRYWKLDDRQAKFHLVAHDIGGAVAQRFAILSPLRQHIRTITLIDSVSFDSYPSKRTLEQMQSGLHKLVKAPDADHRAHFREWLLSAVAKPNQLESSSLSTYLDYISGAIGQPSLIQHQIQHYDPKHTMEVADRYSELGKVPVKLIWGKEDMWQVTSWAEKLRDAIPGSSLDIIEGAGHFSLEDKPEEISAVLLEHVKQH